MLRSNFAVLSARLKVPSLFTLTLAALTFAANGRAEEFLTCHSPASHAKIDPTANPLRQAPRALESQVKNILHDFAGDDISAFFGIMPAILVTGDSAPNAYVTKINEIVLTKGLLKVVDTDAELAFVVAHELGHIMLGHNSDNARYAFTGGTSHVRDNINRELQADAFALKLLTASGFETQSAIRLLSRLAKFGSEHSAELTQSYPSLDARLAALSGQLTAPRCNLAGSL